MTIDSHGVDSERLYVHGYINENGNLDYVDNYELYVVPGHIHSVNEFSENISSEHGHENAFNFTDPQYDTDWKGSNLSRVSPRKISAANVEGNAIEFNKVIPLSHMSNLDATGKYTFFIKANYKPETGLDPTFHSLTYTDITTGLDIVESLQAEIRVDAGCIHVVNSSDEVSVYTPSGALVYSGFDRTIPLAPGIYIVSVGNLTSKVVI